MRAEIKTVSLWREDETIKTPIYTNQFELITCDEQLKINNLNQCDCIVILAHRYWEKTIRNNQLYKHFFLSCPFEDPKIAKTIFICSAYSRELIKEKFPLLNSISQRACCQLVTLPTNLDLLIGNVYNWTEVNLQRLEHIYNCPHFSHDNFTDRLFDLIDELENIGHHNSTLFLALWEDKIITNLQIIMLGYQHLLKYRERIPAKLIPVEHQFNPIINSIIRINKNVDSIRRFNKSTISLIEGIKALARSVKDDVVIVRSHVVQVRELFKS